MSGRIYNEEEISRLLNRAAELEAERSVSGDKGFKNGLSLEELQQIASESGIDPELVRKAAKEFESSRLSGSADTPKTTINSKEIVCERWLEAAPDRRILDELVLELNHMYNTSDQDVTWWDKLWDDYSGKAKVRKTASSLEWIHTGSDGNFTHRVLLQQRGDRFRIRVSKQVHWGFEWHEKGYLNLMAMPSLVVLTVVGAVMGNIMLNSALVGTGIGLGMFTLLYPFARIFSKSYVNKHRNMVVNTTETLADHTLQLVHERKKSRTDQSEKNIPIEWIEVNSEDQQSSQSSGLKNKLRES